MQLRDLIIADIELNLKFTAPTMLKGHIVCSFSVDSPRFCWKMITCNLCSKINIPVDREWISLIWRVYLQLLLCGIHCRRVICRSNPADALRCSDPDKCYFTGSFPWSSIPWLAEQGPDPIHTHITCTISTSSTPQLYPFHRARASWPLRFTPCVAPSPISNLRLQMWK